MRSFPTDTSVVGTVYPGARRDSEENVDPTFFEHGRVEYVGHVDVSVAVHLLWFQCRPWKTPSSRSESGPGELGVDPADYSRPSLTPLTFELRRDASLGVLEYPWDPGRDSGRWEFPDRETRTLPEPSGSERLYGRPRTRATDHLS